MCTVTYIPKAGSGFILTSSRDEKTTRTTLPPAAEVLGGDEVLYPKDTEKGGSWIGAAASGRIHVLLNGAFEKHDLVPENKVSRGRILLESFKHSSSTAYLSQAKLENVEPFTMVIITSGEEGNGLAVFRWDGLERHIGFPDPSLPQIWSSATLYDQKIRLKREMWFKAWHQSNVWIDAENAMEFHTACHTDDKANNILMYRSDNLKTVSITQVDLEHLAFRMDYYDLLREQKRTLEQKIKLKEYA